MQPTMKLRWKRADRTYKTDPAIEDGYGDELVLQQWWEDIEMRKVGEGVNAFSMPVAFGEWRDIPIEEEQ